MRITCTESNATGAEHSLKSKMQRAGEESRGYQPARVISTQREIPDTFVQSAWISWRETSSSKPFILKPLTQK